MKYSYKTEINNALHPSASDVEFKVISIQGENLKHF